MDQEEAVNDPTDDATVAATLLQGIKSDLRAVAKFPRSALSLDDLAEVDELVSALWGARDRRAA